jgi:hypothetical protein
MFVIPWGMTTFSLKLPDRLARQLEEEARLMQKSKSSLVREALQEKLALKAGKRKPSCHDLAKDLCGSIKGGPTDLASNEKYLEEAILKDSVRGQNHR